MSTFLLRDALSMQLAIIFDGTPEIAGYFLGGSCRFGYDKIDSDIDYHLLIEGIPSEAKAVLQRILKCNIQHDTVSYDGCFVTYSLPQYSIHLNVYDTKEAFLAEKEYHELIEDMLDSNSKLLEFINKLPYGTIDGKTKYKFLKELI